MNRIILMIIIGLSFSLNSIEQSQNEIFVIPELSDFDPRLFKRKFFVSGDIAEKLIQLDRKLYINRNYVLKLNEISGIHEEVKIRLCEGTRDSIGISFVGYGCRTDFKREEIKVQNRQIWGIIVLITGPNSKNELIIDNEDEERLVIEFLMQL